MDTVRIFQDPDICHKLWERFWPKDCIFDLWPVRACFMEHYRRPLYFMLADRDYRESRLLALTWIEEEGVFGHFPGETWQGKTWLEQNKIAGTGRRPIQMLADRLPDKCFVRYIDGDFLPAWESDVSVDETGYLFFPKQYDFSFENYKNAFPRKSLKKIDREINGLHGQKVVFRHNHMADAGRMFEMNLSAFGETSYFYDRRFFNAFVDLLSFLDQNNLLRLTSVTVGGKLAAVDVGTLWNNTYTILAGATDPDFPGVAKLINFHHIEWACLRRLAAVDFLCGDFNWKSRFRLQPRPLYKICSPELDAVTGFHANERALSCAV
jgi:CelD/BcsL family acetyltransferase involved in cellulose biosynthesis